MTETSILYISISCVIITLIICGTIIFNNWYDTWRRETINLLKDTALQFYNTCVHETQSGNKVCSANDEEVVNFLMFIHKKLSKL